ncbi:hypothetical protein [Streptomyces omiyaensis]|uniref:hypothetical protein n=1 Tax=Streptomyces omiyaensis TaxID=68247 RepID=UPI0036FFDBC0
MPYEPFAAGEIITAEKLRTRIVEVVMDWTPLASLGTFQNSFTANATMAPRMRIVRVMGSLEWQYEGRISNTGAQPLVNNVVSMFLFDAAYRPTVERGFTGYGASSAHHGVRIGLMVSGSLSASVPAAGTSPTSVWLDGMRFTTPT